MKKFYTAALLSATTVMAQGVYELEPFVVTANNYEQPLSDTTENISIITAQELSEAQVQTVAQALSTFANIQVTTNGGLGQAASVRLRGFDSKRVLVLIDGVRVNDVTGLNGATFEHLLLNDVARIEIIKGAQSGIWGADASAGVINIITKASKEGFHASLRAAYGSYNTTEAALGLSYKAKLFDLKFSVDSIGSDGFSAAEPKYGDSNYGKHGDSVGFEKDAYENQTYHGVLGFNLSKHDRLAFDVKRIKAYVEYDAAAGVDANNVDDPFNFGVSNYFNDITQNFYQSTYTHKSDKHQAEVKAAYSDFNRTQYGGYTGSLLEYSAKDMYRYGATSALQLGLDYQKATQGLSAGTSLDKSYENQALFLSNLNRLGDVTLSEALRYDAYDNFDNKLTGKVGFKYALGDAWLKCNTATGYNVPTLYQLYDGFAGNATLLPESTTSYDVSASHKGITIGYFYNSIENLIDYDTTTFKYANISGTSILKGLEFAYEKRYSKLLDIALDYTYLDARDSEGKVLARRANHQLNLRIKSAFTQAFSTLIDAQYVGTRYDKVDLSGAQTGKYTLVNVALNYKTEKVHYFVKVNNLFDTFYQVADGYQSPGLNIKAGVSSTF